MSKIEQIIEEIEEFIDECKYQTLSNTKIIVNRDELEELIAELKHCIPDEIKKYQRIIANRDAILKDAQDKSDEMVRKANEMTSTLVSEHEIMQQAFKEANNVIEDATQKAGDILDRATLEANEVRKAAMKYTDDSLASIQEILSGSIEGMTVKYDSLIRSLEANLDITTQNRKALHSSPTAEPVEVAANAISDEETFYDPYSDIATEPEFQEPVYGQHSPKKSIFASSAEAELEQFLAQEEEPPSSDVEEITNINPL